MAHIVKVISGGQTGADMAGLRAARRACIATGGTAPRGWRTERGPMPSLAQYGLRQHSSPSYPPRTVKNIVDSDVTLLIVESTNLDGGSAFTSEKCLRLRRPVLLIPRHRMSNSNLLVEAEDWLDFQGNDELIVNVAGNRESKAPGIEKEATDFLAKLFRSMR